ncbi:MAG: transcriptional regulator [Thermoplasmatota archaeon]
MEFPLGEWQLIHQPVRLRIMALLYKQRDVGFAEGRDALEITGGNLAFHAKTLADAGLVEQRIVLCPYGFETRIKITATGSERFRAYLAALREFLGQVGPIA